MQPWDMTHRFRCLANSHSRCLTISDSVSAQVTNPPIDAIREEVVTSTSTYIGEDGNLLHEQPENCRVLRIKNPILTDTDLLKIKNMDVPGIQVGVIPITYYKNTSLKKAIDRLFLEADRAYKDGVNVLILSDRGVDENHVAISFFVGCVSYAAAFGPHEKKNECCHDFRECRAKRSTSFCYLIRLWCLRRKPISGTGYHQTPD